MAARPAPISASSSIISTSPRVRLQDRPACRDRPPSPAPFGHLHSPIVENAPTLRLATMEDAPAIDALMKASTRDLFPLFYDVEQTESCVTFIAVVDQMLIDDGTYFVAEIGDQLVACGGWSRRDKLYTGSGEGA